MYSRLTVNPFLLLMHDGAQFWSHWAHADKMALAALDALGCTITKRIYRSAAMKWLILHENHVHICIQHH